MSNAVSPSTIVTDRTEVVARLKALGLTAEIVRDIAIAAAAGRAESLKVDPYGAPGTLSYIHGVRIKRLRLLPLGWKISRASNVESTVHHGRGIQLCFQNVGQACSVIEPQAISGKGSASRDLVNSGQGDLFETVPVKKGIATSSGKSPTVWLICVSVNDDRVYAEVSCPKHFEGNQFEGFSTRIFVVSESLDPQPEQHKDQDDDFDFDVLVSKK